MSKIVRKYMKIFGQNAGTNERGVIGSLAAGSPAYTTDPETMQTLSNYLDGWNAMIIGGNSPANQDLSSLFNLITYQLSYLMQSGMAEWHAATIYFKGSFASDGLGNVYYSLTDNNVNQALSVTTQWKLYSTDATGVGKDFYGPTAPAGWVFASGRTIGDASSGATERANADTLDLFTLFWTNYTDAILPIFTSAGAGSTRGASAAADFAAHKRISLIDKRGRVSVGKDNMGGTTAGRISATTMTPDGITQGAVGGEQTHVLTTAELASHNHTQNAHGHRALVLAGAIAGASAASPVRTDGSFGADPGVIENSTATNNPIGSDAAHNNVQPSIICNYIIKL